ncbi:MAG: glycosyltransferase family 39 protein [Solirubrobacteraceae bacterium]
MSAVTTPSRLRSLLDVPEIADVHSPAWARRIPERALIGGVLVVLLACSAVIRTRTLSGELWFQEASAIGLAMHPVGALLSDVKAAGASPLYYLLLHFWIQAFGDGEAATHALSLLIGLATIPAAMWAGWSLGGRRAGLFAAILFAFGSFETRYAEAAQPYELTAALGLIATAALIIAFVQRRRWALWLLGAALTAMLYTQGDAILYWIGAGVAIALLARMAPAGTGERRAIARDAGLCFGAAAILYLPWLPATIGQIEHSTAVWHYTPLLGASIPRELLGSERVDVTLLTAVVVAVAPLLASRARRAAGGTDARTYMLLFAIPAVGLLVARIAGTWLPIWAWRYFAPLVAPLLLVGALACARARVVGVAAIVFCIAFLANPSSFAPKHKSDMADVAAQMAPLMARGDMVLVSQPEQAPLTWYYLPRGLKFQTPLGRVADPSWMDWNGALAALRRSNPASLRAVVASLRPGQQVLFVRPLTEGDRNWSTPWTQLVRRRSAQWGQILVGDVADGTLEQVARAPADYQSSCCIASSAVLYRRR